MPEGVRGETNVRLARVEQLLEALLERTRVLTPVEPVPPGPPTDLLPDTVPTGSPPTLPPPEEL